MKTKKPNQQEVWNKIAKEWYEFKDKNKDNKNKFEHSVTKFLKEQKGNILDLGAGTGRYLQKIKRGKMWLVDFSEEMLKIAKKKSTKLKIPAEFVVSEAYNLPFEDSFFEGAICICVLHCIETPWNRKKTIKEIFRVLKPGAKAKISTWDKESGRFKNKEKESYIKWTDKGSRYYYFFTREELEKELKKFGFKILEKIPSKVNIDFIVEKPLTSSHSS